VIRTWRHILSVIVASILALTSAQALADVWTQPTTEELEMTAEPAAPGAAAVYLFRDERVDDKLHIHTTYVRLKILTEKGREYAIQEISYQAAEYKITGVKGRTIHSDGTVIPFTGKPFEKVLDRNGGAQYKAIVFALPDVQVGSILEYRYELTYSDHLVVSPSWFLQGDLYVRKAHYQFIPFERRVTNEHGDVTFDSINYSTYLPQGVSVVWHPNLNYYTVDVEKIPVFAREEYTPPMQNNTYRAMFYYTAAKTADEYWATEGKYWSKSVERFMDTGKLSGVVNQIVGPTDPPAVKLQKIYAAVMKLENTNFDPEPKEAEDKTQVTKAESAADVWERKHGSRNEITLLFVGLARAAGSKAYAGIVTSRDRSLFVADYLKMGQLNDEIAIVETDGKEQFFDPGERYAAFGELHWKHTATQGVRQTDRGAVLFETPTPGYKSTNVLRTASLQVQADGKVSGTILIVLTGNRALFWREFALRNDEDGLKQKFQESVQQQMPPGIEVKIDHFLGVTDWESNFVAYLKVNGLMGTATASFVFLPATFFAATSRPLFALDTRTQPIDLNYAYAIQDTVSIKLPPQFDVTGLPKDTEFVYSQNAFYRAKFTHDAGLVKSVRLLVLGNIFYKAEEYPALKDFYSKVNSKDKEPLALQISRATAPSAAGSVVAGKTE